MDALFDGASMMLVSGRIFALSPVRKSAAKKDIPAADLRL
jgi:hypothetical protein